MRLLLYPLNWFASTPHTPCAGGERYLKYLCDYLISKGHDIKCACLTSVPYTNDGVECVPVAQMQAWQTDNNDLCEWADIIITQLNGTNMAYNKAMQFKKPLLFIAHNTVTSHMVQYASQCQVIYNSEFVKSVVHPLWGLPNKVLTPPINYRDFKRTTNGKYITLVNCNELKGGELFVKLAEALPQYQFLGVKGGYGDQITAELPNLTYIENGSRNMQDVYAETRILLQPSSFETYGQAVMEAMCCGIPVIVHPTQGLKECVGNGGQFADRNNLQQYKEKILDLDNTWQQWSDKAFNRAVELDPELKLADVEKWMEGIIRK